MYCKISTISQYLTSRLTVVGRCLDPKIFLHFVYVVINTSRLSESDYFPEYSCIISLLSEFVFFIPEIFPKGVTVFIDNGLVRLQRYGDGCKPFGEINVCTDVLRLTSITNGIQAIYCETTTYLLDVLSPPAFQTFQSDKHGLPFFCSKSSYYSYHKSGKFLHESTTNRRVPLPSSFLFHKDNVVWGDCVNNEFVVMLTAEGIVFSITLETKLVNLIGYSQTIPRIFKTTVLVNNLTHAIIYDLNTSSQLDVLEQEFVMGYIVRNVDHCMTFSKPERKVTFRDKMINCMSGWLMFLMMAPLMFGM